MARPIALLLTILLSLAGCGGTPARDPLEGTAWLLLSLHGRPPLEGTRITLGFSDGFVSGSAGCNSYAPLVIAGQEARYRYRATADGRLSIPGSSSPRWDA